MILGYTAHIGFIPEFECFLSVDVEWEKGNPTLIISDVLDTDGKTSILGNEDKFWTDFACRILDQAEDDVKLRDRAVEQASYERAA